MHSVGCVVDSQTPAIGTGERWPPVVAALVTPNKSSRVSATSCVGSREHSKSCVAASSVECDDCDANLVASIAQGDHAAFRKLNRRYFHRIKHFVRAVTYRSDIIDEVTNETLWVVWQCAPRFRGDSKVSTWIMGVARNLTFKALRALRHSASNPPDALAQSVDEPTAQYELMDWVDDALARLPSQQRTVLEMFYRLDQSCEEIARALGCPINTVKTRMFHGRQKLRALLPRTAGL